MNSDAQIFLLPCWLLSLAWKPIKDKHRDLFLKLWLCQHPKPVQRPLGGARPQRLQQDAGVAEVARATGPGQRLPRESGWWCGSWPATSREPQSIRHIQQLTDPLTICRGHLGRYVHALPAVQWVQTQRRTRAWI